jgi:hypothetical protein
MNNGPWYIVTVFCVNDSEQVSRKFADEFASAEIILISGKHFTQTNT